MRITQLNATFVGAGGPGITNADGSPAPERKGVGLMMDCPCGNKDCEPLYVAFENPLDGGPAHANKHQPLWERTGDTVETVTLRPSILRVGSCGWHGYLTNGDIARC